MTLMWWLHLLGSLPLFLLEHRIEAKHANLSCDMPAACQSFETQVRCTVVMGCNTTQAPSIQPTAPNRHRQNLKKEWWAMHTLLKEEALQKGTTTKVIFLGDSITERYRGTSVGRPLGHGAKTISAFRKHFPENALALGIGADETQHLLWRLLHGELGPMQPRAAVVLIGTNNFGIGQMSGNDTLLGIVAVAEVLLSLLSSTQIFITGILPRAYQGSFKEEIRFVNSLLHIMADRHHSGRLHYLDCSPIFLSPDGTIQLDLMPDHLHPSALGADLMLGNCVVPALQPYLT